MSQISSTYLSVVSKNIDLWLQRTAQLTDGDLATLDKKFPHLRRAIQQAIVTPHMQSENTAVLVKQSYLLVERYGRWLSWLPLIDSVVAYCVEENPSLLFDLLIQKGVFLRFSRQLDQAIMIHHQAQEIAKRIEDSRLLAEALFNLCVDYRLKRDYDAAQRFGLQSLALYREIDDSNESQAVTLSSLGLIALELGKPEDLTTAEKRFKESIELADPEYKPILIGRTLINLAITLREQNKLDEAFDSFQKAEQLLSMTNSELDKSKLSNTLGTYYVKLGKWQEAEASFRQANSRRLRESGDIFTQASLNQNLAIVLLKQGRAREAELMLYSGLKLWRQVNDQILLANAIGTLAEALSAQKKTKDARFNYDEAISLLNNAPTLTEQANRLIKEFEKKKEDLAY